MARAQKEAAAELKKVEASAKGVQRELQRAFSDAGQDEFERSMRVIRNASDYTEKEVRDAARRVAQDLKGRYRELGADIGQTLMGVSRTAQVAFAAITAYSLKLASDAGEIESAFAVAFGSAEADARAFSDTLADAVGRDAVVLREQMTRLQLVITGTGVAADTAAQMVKTLTASGVDAGSLFNTSDAEALQKIISGLTGETEPLKAFGVVISQAAVEAELLRLGFKGNASEASEAAKSIARANLIIEGLSVAQGDAARTADSAANTTKRMTAEFNKAARDLGTELLPAMVQVFGAATDVLKAFNDLPGGVQVAGLAFLGLIAARGPIAGLLANLARVISLARATKAALVAIGAGGAIAGAGGGAAAGAATGGILAPAAAIAGTLSLSGDTGPINLDALIASRQREIERSSARNRPALERSLQDLYRARSQRNAQLEGTAAAAVVGQSQDAGISPGRNVEGSVVGGFSLPPGLRTGGSRSGGRGATGPTEAEITAMREALALQAALDAARIEATNQATIKREQMAEWERLSLEFWEEIGRAQERSNELLGMQLSDQIELARLSGDEGLLRDLLREEEIRRRIVDLMRLTPGLTAEAARNQATGTTNDRDAAERIGGMRDEFRRAFSEGVGAAIDGDLGSFFQSMADRFTDRMLENLADDLFDLLAQAAKSMGSQGGGGGGGWVSAGLNFLSSAFGGGRAKGGPMTGGSWYRVGEHGPENIVMPQDGFAIPKGGMAGSAARGAGRVMEHRVTVVPERESFISLASDAATPVAAASGGAAFAGARQQVPADMARANRYTLSRRQ